MSRYGLRMSLGMALLGILLLTGCPPRQTQQPVTEEPAETETEVAGTEEGASTVNVTLDAQGLRLEPTQVPPGDLTMNVTNNTNAARQVRIQGQNVNQATNTIQPGNTGTITVQNMQPGNYQVFVMGMQDQPAMRATLRVTRDADGQQPPPQQQTRTTTVRIRLQQDQFTVDPATIPDGNILLHFENASNTAKTFTMAQGGQRAAHTLQPNQTMTLRIERTAPNRYTINPPQRQQQTQRQPQGGR